MFLQNLRHTILLGLKSIKVQRLRATLTVLGIVLGVASVIVMLALGEAARHKAVEQIRTLGATNLIIRSIKPTEQDKLREKDSILTYGLTRTDLERIVATVPTVTAAIPVREFRKELRHLERRLDGRVVGVTPQYLDMNGLTLARGRFISSFDDEQFENVAVLGAETAAVLFPMEDPIGGDVRVDKQLYRIIGVTQHRAPSAGAGTSLSGQDFNRDVYIPFGTDQSRFGKILFEHRSGSFVAEKLEISQITVTVDKMDNVRKTAEIIEGMLAPFHPQKDTSITVPLDLLEKAEQAQRIFTIVLGAIASVSLVVGGIGIMNIMLATVSERTREIGIRRALGARKRDIRRQFLIETLVLAGIGGLLGVTLGIGVSYLITVLVDFPTIVRPWSPMLAFSIALATGVVFGLYPAWRASNLDPIEALRHV